ncbi:hypothetical protein PsorP6_014662 [Peronosclerospora sorghi]|uniref:Uncharacterized protein n=1 Tax=Peronosclerospora sorghi TaxID=230839 RepID=A0ACC0VSX7_9STRA|nr:hypothetical protein PsorP6_014662 [Peronosclerospora sorghi]
MSHFLSLKFKVVLAALLTVNDALQRVNAMDMGDMPHDPISGKMVMSKAYTFELQHGQKLRFATHETLELFVQDPKRGLKGVASPLATHDPDHETHGTSVLCPVCGMASLVSSGPQVVMQHGDQAVHTCSMTHARHVYDDILLFQVQTDTTKTVKQSTAFCTGPGTTMLNGFSIPGSSTPCILLWFSGWVLDSRVRYIFGALFVALVAVFNEYLLHLRRLLRSENSLNRLWSSKAPLAPESALLLPSSAQNLSPVESRGPAWFCRLSRETQHGIHSLLHGVTLFVSYMLMLVSMTYDVTLLLWVIVGYVCGYYIFGERREAPLSIEEMEARMS